jgi:hypothetical protein
MSVKELWETAGLTTVLLPSGFQARGTMPSPTEIVRRKIVPWQLRQAIVGLMGKTMGELTELEHAQLVEGRRYQVSAFVREMAPPGSAEFEPIQLTVDELSRMPPGDVEALDDLIMGIATAAMITARSRVALGELDKESAERIEQEEAEGTVDGWTDFRDESGGAADGARGPEMEHPAIGAAADPEPTHRAARRRGTTSAARKAGAGRGAARQES